MKETNSKRLIQSRKRVAAVGKRDCQKRKEDGKNNEQMMVTDMQKCNKVTDEQEMKKWSKTSGKITKDIKNIGAEKA